MIDVIDETNFNQYFFDIKTNRPKKGQVLARYTAMADFVDGDVKQFVLSCLLRNKVGADMATQVMRYHCRATEPDSIRVPCEMAEDLKSGMTREQVLEKSYRFQLEYFYWTEMQYVPEDDPHWEIITLTKMEFEEAEKELAYEDSVRFEPATWLMERTDFGEEV